MNRHVVAGMVGLVLAGCATTRTDPSQAGAGAGTGRTLPPVGLTEFPSIHETIVRDNPRIDPAQITAERLHGPGRAVSNDPRYAANGPRPAPFGEIPPPAAPRQQAVAAQSPQAPAPADTIAAGTAAPPQSDPAQPTPAPEQPNPVLAGTTPTPASPGPDAAPSANPTPPVGEPGPTLTARPDVMPSAETPKVATATEPASAPDASKPIEAPAPVPTTEPSPAPAVSALAETKPAEAPKAAEVPKGLAPDLNVGSESKPPGEPALMLPPSTVAEAKPATDPAPAPVSTTAKAAHPAGPDPSLAAEPDVMPAMGPATASVTASTKPPVPASGPLAKPDPSLAADPDVMPVLPPARASAPLMELPPSETAMNPKPEPAPPNPAAPEPELPPMVGQTRPPVAPSQPPPSPEVPPEPALPELPAAMPPLPVGASGKPDPSLAADPDVMPPLPPSMLPGPSMPPGARINPLPLKDTQTAPASAPAPHEPEEELGSVPPIDLPPLPPLDPNKTLPTVPALAKPPRVDDSLTRTGLTKTAPAPAPKSSKAPAPTSTDPGLPLPSALSSPPKPASPIEPAELPLPVLPPATPIPQETTAPAPAPARPGPTASADPAVQPASVSSSNMASAEIRSTGRPVDYKEAGRAAAIVGDEVITVHELANALNDRMKGMPQGQRFSPDEQRMMQAGVLNTLIDRSVVYQEAKRVAKDPKKINMINTYADKIFHDEEVPPLMRKSGATNEYELKQKMKEHGVSFDQMRDQFRRDFFCQTYIEQKVGPKLKVELPEKYDYYYAHLSDFDEPARITWREVVVEVSKYPSRTAASQKADALLGRLRRGEDFAQVARAESDGPNKSDGGLWETSPGSYAIAPVNDALGKLPLNQISPVIEATSSYHIVRVEKQREAGPATFPEVQDKIERLLRKQKVEREKLAFVQKLRDQMPITTMFDQKDDVPTSATQAAAPNP